MPRTTKTTAKKRSARPSPARRRGGGGGAGKLTLAFILGIGVAAGAAYLYLHRTPPRPMASAPAEAAPPPVTQPAPAPAPPPRTAPFGTSEDVFEAGARQYSARCASCHGTPVTDAAAIPQAQQFWRKARHAVAAQAPGELYAGIFTGAPDKGMPSYAHTLTDTEIWQLALLLKNADQDLPDPVLKLLDTPPKR